MFRYLVTEEGTLGAPFAEEPDDTLPLTADFFENPDGTVTLLRWPRLKRPAVLPETVEGRPLSAIAATAFAQEHLPEERFSEMFSGVISYSMFSMKMGRYRAHETTDEGGPTEVRIPRTVKRIGAYAFWRCRNLREIGIPEGVTELPAGVFGECTSLEAVRLPEGLIAIGYMPRPTDQVMPDVGTFAGCHNLSALTLPKSLVSLGAQTFNSAGLVHLTVHDGEGECWERKIAVASTAFHHTAKLLRLDKASENGAVQVRIALPPARDKILAGDSWFGPILRIPLDFFEKPASYFDTLAHDAFRLDFSGRMALSRLPYDAGLTEESRGWYLELLVRYFGNAEQFMPEKENAFEALFGFLEKRPELQASHMSEILRTAGLLGLPAELISRMMEVRTRRFSSVTGFEDLDLDL